MKRKHLEMFAPRELKPAGTYIPVVFPRAKKSPPTEATIQAELYAALKLAGLLPILNQTFVLPNMKARSGRPEKIFVDVAIVQSGIFPCAIEVKPGTRLSQVKYLTTRQFAKYLDLGIPFRYCTSLEDIPDTVAWAVWVCEMVPNFEAGRLSIVGRF